VTPRVKSRRVEGIDIARALAGLIMMGGHAFDGWVHPEAKASFAYQVTRFFAVLPLPAFLLLAGAAVAWRVGVAAERREDSAKVRHRVMLRGLQILAWGYAVNVLYALLDGYESLGTLLRADVLHLIGLSIAISAWIGIRASRDSAHPDGRRLTWTAVILGGATTLACPWLSGAASDVTGPHAYVIALFVDVPGITLMPAVPLIAWFSVGVLAAQWMMRARAQASDSGAAGAPRRTLVHMLILGIGAAIAGKIGTDFLVSELGGSLSRAHLAVWFNVIDLGGRGLIVLSAGGLLTNHVTGLARKMLLHLGRGSLFAYVLHIPFCYGKLGGPLSGELGMGSAAAAALALMAFCTVAVVLRDGLRTRIRARLTPPASP